MSSAPPSRRAARLTITATVLGMIVAAIVAGVLDRPAVGQEEPTTTEPEPTTTLLPTTSPPETTTTTAPEPTTTTADATTTTAPTTTAPPTTSRNDRATSTTESTEPPPTASTFVPPPGQPLEPSVPAPVTGGPLTEASTDLLPLFVALSIGGLLVAAGIIAAQWWRTRPDRPPPRPTSPG